MSVNQSQLMLPDGGDLTWMRSSDAHLQRLTYAKSIAAMIKELSQRWAGMSASCLLAVNGIQRLVQPQSHSAAEKGPSGYLFRGENQVRWCTKELTREWLQWLAQGWVCRYTTLVKAGYIRETIEGWGCKKNRISKERKKERNNIISNWCQLSITHDKIKWLWNWRWNTSCGRYS